MQEIILRVRMKVKAVYVVLSFVPRFNIEDQSNLVSHVW